ncbi:hypothetical protein JXA63_01750 [Candidatus Woesebacteria bacterium]|nr:hypothetical protein [Candidatus Woesebacteria bacterium]
MAKSKKKIKQSFRKQLKENKQLLLGISFAIFMLLFASFAARSDFFRTQKNSKPVPEELTKSLTQTPSTTDWLTYTNNEYGFSFKYPEYIREHGFGSSFGNNLIWISGPDSLIIRINIIPSNKNPEKWWSEQVTEPYSKKPVNCYELEIVNNVNSTYYPENILLDLNKKLLIASNTRNDEKICLDPPIVKLIMFSHNNNLIIITSGISTLSEDILSTFEILNEPTISNECVVTGCSNQICASEELVTTCEHKEIYSCYENATCEVQHDGECGWTMDDSLSKCLQSYVGEPSI